MQSSSLDHHLSFRGFLQGRLLQPLLSKRCLTSPGEETGSFFLEADLKRLLVTKIICEFPICVHWLISDEPWWRGTLQRPAGLMEQECLVTNKRSSTCLFSAPCPFGWKCRYPSGTTKMLSVISGFWAVEVWAFFSSPSMSIHVMSPVRKTTRSHPEAPGRRRRTERKINCPCSLATLEPCEMKWNLILPCLINWRVL